MMRTIADAMQITASALLGKSDTVGLDTQVLLAHVLNLTRAQVVAHPERPLSDSEQQEIQRILAQIERNIPLPYILGHWEFYNLTFKVTPDVLIPRPETELLVEHALEWLAVHPARRAADIGSGSGCIAVTLAKHAPHLHVLATDISRPALRVAQENIRRHQVANRVHLLQCDLLPPPPRSLTPSAQIDLIAANLPYIPTQTLHALQVYRHEPSLALDGGADGLRFIRRLLDIAPRWLSPRGIILLEIEAGQGAAALSMAYDRFENAQVHLHQDLGGRDRLLVIQRLDR